jgi:hypothetical protein
VTKPTTKLTPDELLTHLHEALDELGLGELRRALDEALEEPSGDETRLAWLWRLVATRGEDEAFLGVRDRGEPLLHQAPLFRPHAALQHDDVPDELLEVRSKVLEVVHTLGQQDRRAPVLESQNDVIQNELIALLVGCERRIQLLSEGGAGGAARSSSRNHRAASCPGWGRCGHRNPYSADAAVTSSR